ncbi:ATP-binding protein [Nocardiopsis sp. YSL2]|uniref:ATP-binding protein n=1 Tax=Nocardiopsis sp. YSL2 TaxID=2939492 RepID=UPI0026F46225|nr:ATP-binding protein [Nocardiopsis sp. YSL2]
MGSVVRMETFRHGTGHDRHGDVPPVLPRRSRDPRDCAPIVVDRRPEARGHAMVVAGVPEEARMLRYRLGSLSGLPGERRHRLRLLAGELFTNAITHTRSGRPGGLVTVTVFRLPGRAQVKVTDEGPLDDEAATPCVRPRDPERAGGLGLRLVALEADRWGVVHEGHRTTVWFEIDREGPPSPPGPPRPDGPPGPNGASDALGALRAPRSGRRTPEARATPVTDWSRM